MIANQEERIASTFGAADMPAELSPELRVLTPAEVLAVAGGPQTQNTEDVG